MVEATTSQEDMMMSYNYEALQVHNTSDCIMMDTTHHITYVWYSYCTWISYLHLVSIGTALALLYKSERTGFLLVIFTAI